MRYETVAKQDYAIRIIPGNECLTREQLRRRATQFARLLRERRVARVAFVIERRLECAELMLGAHWAGTDYLIVGDESQETGLRVSLQAILAMIQDVGPTMIVVSDTYRSMGSELRAAFRSPYIHKLMIGKCAENWESYDELRDQQSDTALKELGKGEPYPLTGGSTGRSKIIKTPQRLDGKPYPMQDIMSPGKGGVVLVTKSLFGNLGLRAMLAGLLCDASVILLKHWDERLFLQTIEDFGVTHTSLVPAQMVGLLQLPAGERNGYDLSSLKQVLHAGSSCPDAVKLQCIEWFGDRLVELYGTTERFGGTIIYPDEWLKRPGSAGKPFPGFKIVIRDEAGKRLPAGKEGIIWFLQEAEHTPMEYLGNPEATAACYNEHGEATVRDVGYLDEAGYLYVTGRAKRMVIIASANIYPESTEKVLGGHPDVRDVWVFGAPDEALGERLYAFVQLCPGVKPSKRLIDGLIKLCTEALGPLASPARIIVVQDLPRNRESGKIDSQKIAEMEATFQTANISN